jgi:hypothetical protein
MLLTSSIYTLLLDQEESKNMSAFIVSNKHINYLMQFLGQQKDLHLSLNGKGINTANIDDMQNVANILIKQNWKSYNFRYNEKNKVPKNYKFAIDFNFKPNLAQVIKACQCLNYQSCETRNYNQSNAKKIIDTIQYLATQRILNSMDYENLKWEIN